MRASVPCFSKDRVAFAAHAVVTRTSGRVLPAPSTEPATDGELTSYVAYLALEAGLLSDAVTFYRADLERLLAGGLSFVYCPTPPSGVVFSVVPANGKVEFIGGAIVSIERAQAKKLLLDSADKSLATSAAEVVASIPGGDSDGRIARALRSELDGTSPVGTGFVFRPNDTRSLATLWTALKAPQNLLLFLLYSLLETALMLASWAVVGSLSLTGHAGPGALIGWGLLTALATLVQFLGVRQGARFTLRSAMLIKQRLLESAFGVDLDRLRDYGLGGFMILSSQADGILSAVMTLSFATFALMSNVVATLVVLSSTPASQPILLAFLAVLAGILCLAPKLFRATAQQQLDRMSLTTDTVERMLGHRTRLVQQTPRTYHDGEDDGVNEYALRSKSLDRLNAALHVVPRAFYLFGVPAVLFVVMQSPKQDALALTIGGLTLAMGTIGSLVDVMGGGAHVYSLWRSLLPVVQSSVDLKFSDKVLGITNNHSVDALELRGVDFKYPNRPKPIFSDLHLKVKSGDRILIEGQSGGGKTTLVALLSGLRAPTAGLLVIGGLDQYTFGERTLRKCVASAPQFYKNHVFAESLAFNLLLARAWPPSEGDLGEARQLCEELGLGPLLEKMPAGIFQQVGESGWQLSHGERSRVFLARTLLQRAEVVILDESFGTLDPDTLRRCVHVVQRHARTLVVITHR